MERSARVPPPRATASTASPAPRPRRRRPRPAAAAALAALAAAARAPCAHGAQHAQPQRRPPSLTKKAPKTRPKKQRRTPARGASGGAADAAAAPEGAGPPFGGARNNVDGDAGRPVIVQPEWLGRPTAHTASLRGPPESEAGRGATQLHAWPHPDTFRDGEPRRPELEPPAPREWGGADWAGERANFGRPVEYYRDGRPLSNANAGGGGGGGGGDEPGPPSQQSGGEARRASYSGAADGDADAANGSSEGQEQLSYEQWRAMQATYNNNDDDPRTDFDAWMEAKYQQPHVASYRRSPPRGSAAAPAGGAGATLSAGAWADLDVVAGTQVILRPRLENDAGAGEPRVVPPLGAAAHGGSDGGAAAALVVYYYDPRALHSSSGTGEMDAPELTLPDVVYTAAGRALPLEEVHAGGRNEVFLELKPKAVWGRDLGGGGLSERLTTLQSKLNGSYGGDGGGGGSRPQSQDQLIVCGTVATMAVLVGALAAQRLRSRRLLEGCLHPELDDEWEDAASAGAAKKCDDGRSAAGSAGSGSEGGAGGGGTGLPGGGLGALLGGRRRDRAGYYGAEGGLHWRGDLEKFDV